MAKLDIEQMILIKPIADIKVIKETLSRIGIANKKQKILYPTCYLYPNFEDYYIVHFKELFLLTRNDGYMNLCDEDIARKNSIVYCLLHWGLIDLEGIVRGSDGNISSVPESLKPHDKFVFVLKNNEKHKWNISHKFNMNSIDLPE
jgi:hypothetical protein